MARKTRSGSGDNGAALKELPVALCVPPADNPRILNEQSEKFRTLVESVRASGVRVPVAARPLDRAKYELLYGSCRLRACQIAGRETIPAIVYQHLSDEEAFEFTFAENYARDDLSALEEARAVDILLARYSGDARAVAAKLGRSERWVRLRAKLNDLSTAWRDAVANPESDASKLTAGHLELVARFPVDRQDKILRAFADTYWRECPVAVFERWLNEKFLRLLRRAPWKLDDDTLDAKAGACSTCPKRSSLQGLLFHEEDDEASLKRDDRCLDAACWRRKADAFLERRRAALREQHKNLIYVRTEHTPRSGREIEAEKKRFGREVLSLHRFDSAKKSDPGAVPALVVSGPGVGRLRWVKPWGGMSSHGGGRATVKGGPTPLKVRREKLERRRWARVLETLREELDAMKHLPERMQREDLVALAAVFGTDDHRISVYESGGSDGLWRAMRKLAEEPMAADQELWAQVKQVLRLRLLAHSASDITPKHQAEASHVALLIGADLGVMRRRAAEDLPEPKSWKNLKADGTPKTKRAPKAKKRKAG